MAAIAFKLLIVALAVSQGYCLTQIMLPDETYTYLTNDLIGKTITIPKSFLDTLESCYVIFPNGVMYEAYPNDNIPHSNVFFLSAVQPFTSCAIGFRGVGSEFAGTYELLSTVAHSSDNSRSLTRQKFHFNVLYIDPWNAQA